MTTIQVTYRHHNNLPVIMLAVITCIALATLVIPPLVQNAIPGHIPHAEADAIRACAKDPANLIQVWVNSSGQRLNCLIRLPDGRIGNQVIQYSCRQLKWLEITCYQIGGGTLCEAVNVLSAKACELVYSK